MTMGEVLRQWMVKLEWYSTLFPRIPVPIQKDLMQKLKERPPQAPGYQEEEEEEEEPEPEPEREEPRRPRHIPDGEVSFGEAERSVQHRRSPEYRRHKIDHHQGEDQDLQEDEGPDHREISRERKGKVTVQKKESTQTLPLQETIPVPKE